MEPVDQNNPAARLHAILSRAKQETGDPHRTGKPSMTAVVLWAKVFDIPITHPIPGKVLLEIVSRIIQLDKLIDDTEKGLLAIPGLSDKYFRPFVRIREIPRNSLHALNTEISGSILQISEGDMTVLDFCSEKLEEQHEELVINEDELQAILTDVNTLFDEVKTSEIEAELQTFILDGLESIRRGIYEFKIRGAARLRETVGEIVGSLYVNYKTVMAAGEDESLEKFNKLFNRLSAMVTFANTSVKLLTAFAGPLLPG